MTDDAIVERILDGHTHEFSLLVERYQKSVYNLAYGFVGQQEEALNLARVIFLKAYINLASYRREANFQIWLHRLATMQSLEWQGKSREGKGKVAQSALPTIQSRIREGLAQLRSLIKGH